MSTHKALAKFLKRYQIWTCIYDKNYIISTFRSRCVDIHFSSFSWWFRIWWRRVVAVVSRQFMWWISSPGEYRLATEIENQLRGNHNWYLFNKKYSPLVDILICLRSWKFPITKKPFLSFGIKFFQILWCIFEHRYQFYVFLILYYKLGN